MTMLPLKTMMPYLNHIFFGWLYCSYSHSALLVFMLLWSRIQISISGSMDENAMQAKVSPSSGFECWSRYFSPY